MQPLRRFVSRLGVLGAGLLCGVLACAERPVAAPEIPARLAALERPNLLLIVIDTLRADYTSPYGFAEDTTPELARWADRGVVFERNLAQSSWTKISMASLMASRWPASHGIRAAGDGLGDGTVTLAESLAEAGYRTYGVQTNGWLHQSFGFHQGFERYLFPIGRGARLAKPSTWPHVDKVYDEAARLLDAHPGDEPFFLYLHFMDVHEYAAPPEFKRFGSDGKGAYLASILWVDDGLARIRALLDEAGVLEDTVIVLTSDHGETFGEHGKNGHARNVLTPVLWVPLVLRLPFPVDAIRVPGQVRNVDIAPTLLELAGAEVPASFEGRSLLPLLTGDGGGADRANFAALGQPLYPDAKVQEALNDGAWTFARNIAPDPDRSEFLFDRAIDPGENVNLVGREPAAEARMRQLLDDHRERSAPAAGELRENVDIDPEIEQRLRAMGYLQ